MYADATIHEIDLIMQQSWQAFHQYKKSSLKQRADFMRAVAAELQNADNSLIETAMKETNLPEARLRNEKTRTVFQLTSYADACEKGDWLEARIDTAIVERNPPKPDIRKTLIPLGPVVVFGSSNFPFAYSTAGGDTACALAAGCSVVVKAHPAHAETSTMVAELINKAVAKSNMPENIFMHIYGNSFEVGKTLVTHELTKAVAFTGSYAGGKQLFDWGNERKNPIPVFAEMGSVNPVFLFPEKLQQAANDVAKMYAASITLNAGQFCTNPGIIIGIESEALQQFISASNNEIKKIVPEKMLHPGIAKAYNEKREKALTQHDVIVIAESEKDVIENAGLPTIASTTAQNFIATKILHEEVFGPYSIIIHCKDLNEMKEVAEHLEGQLTSTVIATENELKENTELVEAIKNLCGRMIFNGVPTGVEVCLSMQHGGPFPATTDARFTSVGADGIKRFARPISFQNCPDNLLPDELKNENPLGIWRTVNNELTKDAV
jgi:NADP-dependent aldehyde dehydrogenase